MKKDQAYRQYPQLREGLTVRDQYGQIIGHIKLIRENDFEVERYGLIVHNTTIGFNDIQKFEDGELRVQHHIAGPATPDNLRGPEDRVGAATPDLE